MCEKKKWEKSGFGGPKCGFGGPKWGFSGPIEKGFLGVFFGSFTFCKKACFGRFVEKGAIYTSFWVFGVFWCFLTFFDVFCENLMKSGIYVKFM